MKPFDKILLYDDYCPLCSWYSGLFVRFGLLNASNRVPFSGADPSILAAIDLKKGITEIPLYDPATRETLYGINALLDILGQKMPLVKRIGNFHPVNWFLKKIYKLVSYNRKVIVARKCGAGVFNCTPPLNYFYRVSFLIIFLLFNSLMLFPLHDKLFSHLSFYHLADGIALQKGHLVFVAINCLLACFAGRRMGIEYLGQLNVLALISILLLTILLFLTAIFPLPAWIILVCLVLLTLFVIKEYFRRMKYAGVLPFHKSFTVINIICLTLFLVYVFH